MTLRRIFLGGALLGVSLILATPSFAESLFRLDASAPGEVDPDKGIDYIGSVLAFTLYFSLARRRGFTMASYILALTPLLAMLMSSIFEGKRWPPVTLLGVALVLWGQWQLLRTEAMEALLPPIPGRFVAPHGQTVGQGEPVQVFAGCNHKLSCNLFGHA